MKNIILLILLSVTIFSCNNSNSIKLKELELKEKELELKEKELDTKNSNQNKINTNDAIRLAEKEFEKYLPKILKSNDAVLDVQSSYTGDFTGDGIEDIAIVFTLSPNTGGNAIVGQGISLYQNTGFNVKVIAGYEPDYLFSFNRISGGSIYVDKLEYAEDDARCCPSIKEEKRLIISGSNVY